MKSSQGVPLTKTGKLEWSCCQGHSFEMTPHAVLRGGHWCLECIAPASNYVEVAAKNSFAAQVLTGGSGE